MMEKDITGAKEMDFTIQKDSIGLRERGIMIQKDTIGVKGMDFMIQRDIIEVLETVSMTIMDIGVAEVVKGRSNASDKKLSLSKYD